MSWLNLNHSLNSLKGQITNFASEVLSESPAQDIANESLQVDTSGKELEEKCRNQELEIASLKKLVDELQTSLQSEKLTKQNGVKEEESSWYWDPPSQTPQNSEKAEKHYRTRIRELQDEIASMKQRDIVDLRGDQEIIKLREENQNLTSNLEDLDTQHQMAMERLLSLKRELQTNFENLKQEHKDLKSANDEYAAEITKLRSKIGERDHEFDSAKISKADYDTLLQKYQNLERIHGLLKENAEKFQEENQDLHEEVFKLQEQVTKLEHDLEVSHKSTESDVVPRDIYENLLSKFNELKDRRNSNQIHLDEINIDDNAKGVIETLKRDISELKYKLTQKESNGQETGDSKIIRSEKVMQLYNKYVNFELPIDYVGEIPSAGDNIVLFKLESVFKTLNSFKKEIDTLDHKLSEKNLNTNHLQTQIDDLTTENDFLTTDIQHLERELSEMKKNNDFLISEIAALKNTSKLEPIIETHEDNLAKLETELADSNKMNKVFEAEIQRILKELDEVRTEKLSLREALRELKQKYSTMLEEFEMLRTQSKAVEELEHNMKKEDHESLKRTADEVDELKSRLIGANATNEQLSIDIHILENDKVLLSKAVKDLQQALDEKSYAHKELESLKLTLDHKLHDFESKLDEVIKDKQNLESDKHTLQKKVKTLEEQLSIVNNTTDEKLQDIIAEKNKLDKKLHQMSVENETLAESIKSLKEAMNDLKQKEQELLTENRNLKKDIQAEQESKTAEELESKIQDTFNKEISSLKAENKILAEKKVQLEAELSTTDRKILHLEEEFDKLIVDLNEKDSLVDGLNTSAHQSNTTIKKLNEYVSDLESSITKKIEDIKRLEHSVAELTVKLNNISTGSSRNQEELNKLHNEKEELSKQIYSLNDEINSKNSKISALTLRYEESEKIRENFRTEISNKEKEIKELNQSIVELTDKIKTLENVTHQNDDYANLIEEKNSIEAELAEIKESLSVKDKFIQELKDTQVQNEKMAADYKSILDAAVVEKTELINLVNLKHNESIQYHTEIQRLNHVILEQTNEYKKLIEEKDKLIESTAANCSHCENLKVTLKEKDGIIVSLNQNLSEFERMKSELVAANESIKRLKEKCENHEKNLSVQLETVKSLTAENLQLSETEQNSARELERLRRHLVETEDNYTQELMVSEQKLTECQARLHQVEERAKQTSTVYTSNSIRANQEVETYRNQIKLLEKQREDVQARLGEAEDAKSRSEAALTNLQVVLEQFQLDKEREVHSATEKIRNKMEELRRENHHLQIEITRLNAKLEEALAGLQAASRLGDQVETKRAEINDLKEQVRTLQTSVAAAEERYYNAISNQQDKVDKNLVKNLIINYVLTAGGNSNNKTQCLRVLSTVLDFNQQECEKLGLARSASQPDSLAAEFVKFLQNESKPRAPLPNMMTLAQGSSRSTTPNSRKSSIIGAPPNLPKTGHSRNPSTGSNNLLFHNIDVVETSSQLSRDSDRDLRVLSASLDTGVNQTRNTEGAILKSVLKDM